MLTLLGNLFIAHIISMLAVHGTAKALNYEVDDDYTWVPFLGLVGNVYIMGAMISNARYGVLKSLTNKMNTSSAMKQIEGKVKDEFYGYSYYQLEEYTNKFTRVLDKLGISYNPPYVSSDYEKEKYYHSNLFILIKGSKCYTLDREWLTPQSKQRATNVSDAFRIVIGLLSNQKLPTKAIPVLFNMIDTMYTIYGEADTSIIGYDVQQSLITALHEYYLTFDKILKAEKAIAQKELEEKIEFHKEIAMPRINKVAELLQGIQTDYDEQLKKYDIKL